MNNFGYALFYSFFEKLNVFLVTVFSSLMESFGGFATAFLLLYIVLVGIDTMYTNKIIKSQSDLMEFIGSIIIAGVLVAGLEYGFYKEWFVNPIVGTTTKLASFFIGTINDDFASGSGIKSLFQNLDALSFKIFDFLLKYDPPGATWATNAWGYMQAGLLAIALFASYAGAYTVFLVLLILGYFSMYVLFTVGGVCIFFAAFSKTRFIFYSWLKAVINYALVIVFTSIIMSICYFGLSEELTALIAIKGSGSLFTTQYLSALCWSVLTFGVLLKAPDFAAALSGGQAGSTSSIAGGIGAVAGAGASVMGLSAMTGQGGGAAQAGGRMAMAGGKAGGNLAMQAAARPFSAMKGMLPGQQKEQK